jgi:subtilisin family serine protease
MYQPDIPAALVSATTRKESTMAARNTKNGEFVQSHRNTYRRPCQVLVSSKDADFVVDHLRKLVGAEVRHDDSDDLGLLCLQWEGEDNVDELIDTMREECDDHYAGWTPTVSPNHVLGPNIDVLTGQPMDIGGPAGRPKRASDPLPNRAFLKVGQGVTVGVIDTGIAPHPWMEGCVLAGAEDLETTRLDVAPQDEQLDPQAGHGTFIAGLVLRQAPGATIRAVQVLDSTGVADARDVAKAIAKLARANVDVINLSLGGYTRSNRGPMSLQKALSLVPASTAVVAAAGNHDPDNPKLSGFQPARPNYPSAFEGVLSVGALDSSGHQVAPFSNYGPWVDVFTVGEDLQSTFPTFRGEGSGQQFDGWATWSGTSFAAPMVAGAIAARMSLDGGISGAEAARRLVRDARRSREAEGAPGRVATLALPPLI